MRGGTDDSYGIEVAKLAGVPTEVVKRAREILKDIESGARPAAVSSAKQKDDTYDLLSGISASKEAETADKLRSIDINTLTPIEALNTLYELKRLLGED